MVWEGLGRHCKLALQGNGNASIRGKPGWRGRGRCGCMHTLTGSHTYSLANREAGAQTYCIDMLTTGRKTHTIWKSSKQFCHFGAQELTAPLSGVTRVSRPCLRGVTCVQVLCMHHRELSLQLCWAQGRLLWKNTCWIAGDVATIVHVD